MWLGDLTGDQAPSWAVVGGWGGSIPATPTQPGVLRAADFFMVLDSHCLEQPGVLYNPDTPGCDPGTWCYVLSLSLGSRTAYVPGSQGSEPQNIISCFMVKEARHPRRRPQPLAPASHPSFMLDFGTTTVPTQFLRLMLITQSPSNCPWIAEASQRPWLGHLTLNRWLPWKP